MPSNEQTCVENSDIHIKDNLKDINTTSSLADIPQNQQQLEFVQAAPDSPVTYHNASYDDDIRELNIGTYTKRLVVMVVTTSTDFIISKGAWPPSSARLQPQQATSRGGPQDMHSASC